MEMGSGDNFAAFGRIFAVQLFFLHLLRSATQIRTGYLK